MRRASHSPLNLLAGIEHQAVAPELADRMAAHAVSVLKNISRTFQGESNVDSSELKRPLKYSGEALVQRVSENFRQTLVSALTSPPALCNGAEVKAFIVRLAEGANYDLQRDDAPFFRTWDTKVPSHPRKEFVEQQFNDFCGALAARINSRDHEATALAAWIEKRFNAEIHPLGDGCGRTSKLLSSFFLGLQGISLPAFPSRSEYFSEVNKDHASWAIYYRGLIAAAWVRDFAPLAHAQMND